MLCWAAHPTSHTHSHTHATRTPHPNGKRSQTFQRPWISQSKPPSAVCAYLCISTVQRPLWNCLYLIDSPRPFFFVPPQRQLCFPLVGPTIDQRLSRTRLLGKVSVCLSQESVLWPSFGAAFHPRPLFAVLQRACSGCTFLSLSPRLALWHTH